MSLTKEKRIYDLAVIEERNTSQKNLQNTKDKKKINVKGERFVTNNTIFDDVFRTMLEKLPSLVIPLINEVFGTEYPEDTPVIQLRNEHKIEGESIEADSHLFIGNKIYHIECQSTSDAKMVIRMIEYDFATALEHARKENGKYWIYFPHSCVLYLRGRGKSDTLEMEIIMPDGRVIDYRVPAIYMEAYTQDVMLQKNLLFLLPFYVMRYEKKKHELEENTEKLNHLLEEYISMEKHLEGALLNQGKEKEFRDLIELITRIADYIFADTGKAKKGVGEIMGGKVLELESDRLIRQGLERGLEQGLERGEKQKARSTALKMLVRGRDTEEEIAEITGLSLEEIQELKQKESA